MMTLGNVMKEDKSGHKIARKNGSGPLPFPIIIQQNTGRK